MSHWPTDMQPCIHCARYVCVCQGGVKTVKEDIKDMHADALVSRLKRKAEREGVCWICWEKHEPSDACLMGIAQRKKEARELKQNEEEKLALLGPPLKLARDMTLRDWFAGQAMAGMLASDMDVFRSDHLAGNAYYHADMMMGLVDSD